MSPATGVPSPQDAVVSVKVLQAVAHEIRQPLSTIESIAYYLSMVLPREEDKIREQLGRLGQLVEQSNWILNSGLHLADPLPISPEPMDLGELVTRAIAARTEGIHSQPRLDLAGALPLVQLDPNLGRALVENLLTLFRPLASESCPVRLRTHPSSDGGVLLELATAVTGYRSEASLGVGATLGLASARRVSEAHGGSVELEIDPENGVRLRLKLLQA